MGLENFKNIKSPKHKSHMVRTSIIKRNGMYEMSFRLSILHMNEAMHVIGYSTFPFKLDIIYILTNTLQGKKMCYFEMIFKYY